MSERKFNRLELIRERHRKLILNPRREVESVFSEDWEEESHLWREPCLLELAKLGDDDE